MSIPLRRTKSVIRGLAPVVVTLATLLATATPGRAQVRDSASTARTIIAPQHGQATASMRVKTVAVTDVWRFTRAPWVAAARAVTVPAAGHAPTGVAP